MTRTVFRVKFLGQKSTLPDNTADGSEKACAKTCINGNMTITPMNARRL
jgi:hypothetical protein